MIKALLAAVVLGLASSVFADDEPAADDPAAESASAAQDARGVGAKTTYAAPVAGAASSVNEESSPISQSAVGARGATVRSGGSAPVKGGAFQTAPGSGGSGGSGSGGSALPEEIQGTKFEVSENLKSMAHHAGSHGAASVTREKQGYAIGFKTGPASQFGDIRSGVCAAGETPVVPHVDGCWWYVWIAETPGGNPAGGVECTVFKVFPRVATVNWASIDGKGSAVAKALHGHCQLKPEKKYYCNFTATAYSGGFPKECGAGIASPISAYD